MSKEYIGSQEHFEDVICSVNKCFAYEFRDKHPNYSFTIVGYSASPVELNEEYQKLVNITYRGCTETHKCKICKKEVYEKEHR